MRDYLILTGNLIVFVGGFAFLGIATSYDSGGNPWYGAARGAVMGILLGLVLGVGMQDRATTGRPSE